LRLPFSERKNGFFKIAYLNNPITSDHTLVFPIDEHPSLFIIFFVIIPEKMWTKVNGNLLDTLFPFSRTILMRKENAGREYVVVPPFRILHGPAL
jgi:hypothetical protein